MLAYGVVETLAEGLQALAQSARLLAHDFGVAFLAGMEDFRIGAALGL